MKPLFLLVILGALGGCGGPSDAGGSPGPGPDGGASADAGGDAAPLGTAAGCLPVPAAHRAAAAACAANDPDAGVATCGSGTTSVKDACLVDGDCGASGVCLCQRPDTAGPAPCGTPIVVGNACVPSNCRADSDCAACGACIAQESICGPGAEGYYCQTPSDACASNSDCTDQPNGQCAYDVSASRWACRYDAACPG
jgi:hypothetical protein